MKQTPTWPQPQIQTGWRGRTATSCDGASPAPRTSLSDVGDSGGLPDKPGVPVAPCSLLEAQSSLLLQHRLLEPKFFFLSINPLIFENRRPSFTTLQNCPLGNLKALSFRYTSKLFLWMHWSILSLWMNTLHNLWSLFWTEFTQCHVLLKLKLRSSAEFPNFRIRSWIMIVHRKGRIIKSFCQKFPITHRHRLLMRSDTIFNVYIIPSLLKYYKLYHI